MAIADVDSLVKKNSAIDRDAQANTTSIYTAARIFPMLPLKLSTDYTSLNLNQDRLAVVVDMTLDPEGRLLDSDVYRAAVRNHAKLAYNSLAAWLEGEAEIPAAAAAVEGLAENILLQDKAAQMMKSLRHQEGALSLETIEAKAVFQEDIISDLVVEETNRAKQIIEDFMIAANGVTVRFLGVRGIPSLRRVVRVPRRWDRIVEIAAAHAFRLPKSPSPRKLEIFLTMMKKADPRRSITVYERNRADDTFGFGVVFSDATLDNFEKYDAPSYRRITEQFAYWDDIAVHFRGTVHRVGGNGFCGCSRRTLLLILQERARELGVVLLFVLLSPLDAGADHLKALAGVSRQEAVRHDRIETVIEKTTLKCMYDVKTEHDFTTDPRVIELGSAESLLVGLFQERALAEQRAEIPSTGD